MNKDATQAYSKGNAHKQTCKHSEKCWLGLRNRHGCLSACACVRAHTESLIKEAIIGDNWTEVLLLMSSRSASHPCKSFFFPLHLSPPRLLSPVPHNKPPSRLRAPLCTIAGYGAACSPSPAITALQAAQHARQKISASHAQKHTHTHTDTQAKVYLKRFPYPP